MLHQLDMLGFMVGRTEMEEQEEQDLRSSMNAQNLARMKKVPNFVRRQRKRENVKRQVLRRNARRLVVNVIVMPTIPNSVNFVSKIN